MKALYGRNGNKITEFKTGKIVEFKSISLAKKESHRIQKANGGLGCGSLMAF